MSDRSGRVVHCNNDGILMLDVDLAMTGPAEVLLERRSAAAGHTSAVQYT